MTLDDLATILLVEDDDVDVLAVQRGFERSGVSNPVIVAHDGIDALAALRGEGEQQPIRQPYLILLDLNMPRMDGLEFLEEIRRDGQLKRSIVFVLTTSEDDQDRAAAYDRQVAGYLSKNDAGSGLENVVALLKRFEASIQFPPD
jgi:CheY-like chemotaxis protein